MATPSPVTVLATVTQLVTLSPSPSSTGTGDRAPPQGGVLEGVNPAHYDKKNPIILFIIQAFIILCFCRVLHWPLSKIRQPRVIAEVIGGILLGPSVMGRIPHFTTTIFPADAAPNLNLVANLGLTLFLFLVGLEVNLRHLKDNWKVALSVGLAGMALPFGLGCAVAYGLYHEFRDEPGTHPVAFGTYVLFIGVAMAITAFPVLCRILVELKLIHTPVGIIVLSAGVGNDVVGWVLLALCVALVNAGNGLTALWILLTCVGYVLFMCYAVRPAFMHVLRRTGTLENGPSQGIIALTLLIALGSAFFTGIIGVHAIFGAFVAGIICPHEGGFAIKVTEKIEDLVSALLLPLYFALSGLNTNLGLLDNGITWGYVVAVILIAFVAKFIGAAVAARANGLYWRESFTIGSLMSCKGLVELIVLNIGLNANILSQRTFTIFVVMALVTTFATTPLTSFLYPPSYQKKMEAWRRGEIDWDTGLAHAADDDSSGNSINLEKTQHSNENTSNKVQKLLVYLRIDNMPMLLAFISLLGADAQPATPRIHPSRRDPTADDDNNNNSHLSKHRPVQAHGLRMLALTERTSAAMQVSEPPSASTPTTTDPIVNTFRTFGQLNSVAVSGEVSVLPESSFADALATKAADLESDMVLLPWSETGALAQDHAVIPGAAARDKLDCPAYAAFVLDMLAHAPCPVAVFVNRNFGGVKTRSKKSQLPTTATPGATAAPPPSSQLRRIPTSLSIHSARSSPAVAIAAPILDKSHHIFLPFFGTPDDRVACALVLQLVRCAAVTATITHFRGVVVVLDAPSTTPSSPVPALSPSPSAKTPTVTTSPADTNNNTNPATNPNNPDEKATSYLESLQSALPAHVLPRVLFDTVDLSLSLSPTTHNKPNPNSTTKPQPRTQTQILRRALARAALELGNAPRNAGDLLVLGRNAGVRFGVGGGVQDEGVEEGDVEDEGDDDGAASRALGVLGSRAVRGRVKGSVLVVQAGGGAGVGMGSGMGGGV
ncbi:hypothetical protein EJ05DRAFT_513439 [Pseudovirgaria hyperparasitica]|uniref:Cation/H+ exchanger transmembrane domain-containing protein n=1 Tax=Pseudovirgaria hyperparasitica TaxID=470096 RepID=A0A6A6W0M9_9PEZI|nr:uncharacterized protein EJ05DRAFT_513439 [Pseudovirgaria hyperparasitica]KAF2755127.1 hypothetical protein EJ05DRAFT_513439 [Pseudovirgaria hyperparasitica]